MKQADHKMIQSKERQALLISLASIVTAFAALFVAIWQGHETRQFYRKTLTPHINIYWSATSDEVGIKFLSNGTGPAKIEKIELMVNGNKYNALDCKELATAIVALKIEGMVKQQCFKRGQYLSAGSEHGLFWIPDKTSITEEKRLQFNNAIKNLNLCINYKSVYDNHFKECFKKSF